MDDKISRLSRSRIADSHYETHDANKPIDRAGSLQKENFMLIDRIDEVTDAR